MTIIGDQQRVGRMQLEPREILGRPSEPIPRDSMAFDVLDGQEMYLRRILQPRVGLHIECASYAGWNPPYG
jgi:hypothetical protein